MFFRPARHAMFISRNATKLCHPLFGRNLHCTNITNMLWLRSLAGRLLGLVRKCGPLLCDCFLHCEILQSIRLWKHDGVALDSDSTHAKPWHNFWTRKGTVFVLANLRGRSTGPAMSICFLPAIFARPTMLGGVTTFQIKSLRGANLGSAQIQLVQLQCLLAWCCHHLSELVKAWQVEERLQQKQCANCARNLGVCACSRHHCVCDLPRKNPTGANVHLPCQTPGLALHQTQKWFLIFWPHHVGQPLQQVNTLIYSEAPIMLFWSKESVPKVEGLPCGMSIRMF